MRRAVLTYCVMLICLPIGVRAEDALIAVATNFMPAAEELKRRFESTTEHRVTIVGGSTGKLYAQVVNGAPFDALLAADQARPDLLEQSGNGVSGSRFTFAVGRLVLGSIHAQLIREDVTKMLGSPNLRSVAIANPALAPYGAASRQLLQSLGHWLQLEDKLVMGENVGQTYALVATGNADVGILSLSTAIKGSPTKDLHYVELPSSLHDPIRQDAVLLTSGQNNAAAKAFLDYLGSDRARALLTTFGYEFD